MKDTMRFSLSLAVPPPRPRLGSPLLFVMLAMLLLLLSAANSYADSATWRPNPTSGDWNTANNWMPPTVPNGPADTATFDSSNTTDVLLSASTEVNGIVFNAGASAFTITVSAPGVPGVDLTISGVGITNNSGITQNLVTAGASGEHGSGEISFQSNATAGSGSFTNNAGLVADAAPGLMSFHDSSNAGHGTFINSGAISEFGFGGQIRFFNSSTADSGIFLNEGGMHSGSVEAFTQFLDVSSAGNGTFTNNGGAVSRAEGGATEFGDRSSAENGTFSNNGGAVDGAPGGSTQFIGRFFENPTAGNGTFFINGGAVDGAIGGNMFFVGTSSAANATLVATGGLNGGGGGSIFFVDDRQFGVPTGGNCARGGFRQRQSGHKQRFECTGHNRRFD